VSPIDIVNKPAPEGFESFDDYSRYRLEGHGSLAEAAAKVIEVITYCREQSKRRLMVDATRWTGHSNPSAAERFDWAELFAAAAGVAVKCALVVRPELMDPHKFEVTVATNRGMMGNVFDSEKEALEWLLRPTAP
jgi:hypothetical protein